MTNPHPISSGSRQIYPEGRVISQRTASITHPGIDPAIESSITTRRATADEIAFRNGYVQGREQERRIQQHAQRRMQHVYAHQGMVGGLFTGIVLTLTVGFVATLLAVFSPQWEVNAPQDTTSQTNQ